MKMISKKTRAALVLAAGLALSGPAIAQSANPDDIARSAASDTLVLLSADVSRALKLTSIPTSEPIPLVIGTGWNCETNSQGFEICRTFTVVCNNEQSFCTCAVGTCPRP